MVCGQGSAAVRPSRSCGIGGRVWHVVCWGGGRAYTLAGSSSRNLRAAQQARSRLSGRGSGLGAIGSVMRLTVTPLGASGRPASGVAGAVVDYLEGEAGDRGPSLLGGSIENTGAYYADSIEGPGRWLGAGAAFRDLDGVVGRDEFQRVLEGRHPLTGERLVTAQGSSQRGHLSVGTAARTDESGTVQYTVRDVARLALLR